MVKQEYVREFALSFPETKEAPHFDKSSYRVKSKIFMTHNVAENRVCIKLPLIEQDVFIKGNKDIIFPVPNKWGKSGWTLVLLSKVRKDVFKDAVTCAYCEVAPKSLASNYRRELEDER